MVLGIVNSNDPLLLATIYFSLFMSSFFVLTFWQNKPRVSNPKVKKYYKVSIITAAYNEAGTIAKTIENALNLDWPKDKLEIIVVENNGSTDGTYEIAKKYEKRGVRVFSIKEGGKPKAMNFGIKKAKGEIILTMDADTYAKPDALKKMLPYFDDPKVMAASPAIVAKTTKTLAQKIQNTEYLFGVFLRKVFHFMNTVYVTPGAFTAYRKKFFEKHGDYDTTNITEDFEMCMRIQAKGYKVTNSIDALVYTETPKTFKALHKQRLRWFLGFIDTALQYKSLFFTKKRGALSTLILPTVVISIFLTLALFIRALWSFTNDVIDFFQTYYAIRNIDIMANIYTIKLDLFYYKIDTVVLGVVLLTALSIYMFIGAKKYSGYEKPIAIMYVLYFFFYIIVFSLWWMHSILFKLVGRKLKFGGVEWNNSVLKKLTNKA